MIIAIAITILQVGFILLPFISIPLLPAVKFFLFSRHIAAVAALADDDVVVVVIVVLP